MEKVELKFPEGVTSLVNPIPNSPARLSQPLRGDKGKDIL
jgi:hypothetical protein